MNRGVRVVKEILDKILNVPSKMDLKSDRKFPLSEMRTSTDSVEKKCKAGDPREYLAKIFLKISL